MTRSCTPVIRSLHGIISSSVYYRAQLRSSEYARAHFSRPRCVTPMDPSAPIRLELSRTESVGRDRLDAIIALKSQHWPYPYESQTRWFADNVASSDQHLLAWRKD